MNDKKEIAASDKERAEALIYERYASFKKGAMASISRLDGRQRGVSAISDAALYADLSTILSAIDVPAVLIKQKKQGEWLGCFSRDYSKHREFIKSTIDGYIEGEEKGDFYSFKIKSNTESISCIAEFIDDDVVVLINAGEKLLKKFPRANDEITVAWFPVAATIREIFRQRTKSYGRLPDKKIIHDWIQVEEFGQGGGSGKEGKVLGGLKDRDRCTTITISLDLRKSTFAMEQARDATRFATWMTEVITTLTTQAQQSGAIFDKFTGDGVIIHFPVSPPWEPPHPSGEADIAAAEAMERAVTCAAQMVISVHRKLDDLRKILLNDSGKFGAGVGIAIADAYWGVDLEGNPMVVGRGVVNACRAADPAPAGSLFLVNSAYQTFRESRLGRRIGASRVSYATKEFNGDLDVAVWALEAKEIMAAADHSQGGRDYSTSVEHSL